jgi:glycosyltransferase involved in cell wall biosynthesis
MPSFTESFGLVYAEAISQGLPVVYSKGQGFDGQFDEGVVGYHCDANDAGDVAFAIKNVVKKYDVNFFGICVYASKFKWNEICSMYNTIYEGLNI